MVRFFIFALSIAVVSPAQARVAVVIDPCVAISSGEFERLLGIELGSRSLPEDARLQLSCDEAGVALSFRATGRPFSARVVPTGNGDAAMRARLLALASAELVAQADEHPSPPIAPSAVKPAAPAETFFGRRFALDGFGSMSYFARAGALFGGGISAAVYLPRHTEISLDVRAEHGRHGANVGAVAIDVLSATANLSGHYEWSRFRLRFGGGFRIGGARLEGHPSPDSATVGNALWAVWGGPIVTVGGQVVIWRRLHFSFALDGGYVLLPVHGLFGQTSTSLADLDGPWVTAKIGFGIYF